MSILIFEAETDLKEQITKAKAISYVSLLQPAKFSVDEKDFLRVFAAENKYEIDIDSLYPTQSVLVSTVWNLNDDVFDKYETWMARSTPVHMPTNNNHNESEIVGHMTGAWAIDSNNDHVADDTPADKLPDIFHILNSAVIYTAFSEPDLISRAKTLIEEIEANKKFVSMEARFRGFDYALMDSKGVMQILQRNEKTAFLTKHLRAYGGKGEYEGYKVGRLLRNITFTGKGYVDTPANPDSIIFDKDKTFNFISKAFIKDLKTTSGVCINQTLNNGEKNQMSQELETKVNDLTKANEGLTTELNSVKAERDTFKSQVDELTSAKTSLEAKITELTTSNTNLQNEVNTFKQNEIKAKRINKLVAGGYSNEDAEKKVGLFANLNDEQFEVIAVELIEAKKEKKEEKKPEKKDEKSGADLNDVIPEQIINPVTEPDAAVTKSRVEMAALLEKLVTTKKKTKVAQNA